MVLRTQSVMLPDNFTVYYSLHASVLSLSMSGCRPSVFQALAFLASGPTGSGSRGPCRLTPQSSLQLQLILEADLRGAEGLDS
jgi:hypothetical protein